LARIRQGWLTAFLVFLVFIALAAMPFALQSRSSTPWVSSAQRISPIPLPLAPLPLAPVQLSTSAQPVSPDDPPVTIAAVDGARMAALVAGEDLRLRTLLHHISRLTYPEVIPGSGQYDMSSGILSSGISTLVLPGPANYSIADLQSAGAVVPLAQGGFLLIDSVLIGSGATLKLGGTGLPTLLMESSTSGFTSLVTWGGTLELYGDFPESPLKIMSWDRKTNAPVDGRSSGRPYIRAVGGKLDLKNVRVSHLGFWSGRTGGVAWTGISSRASTGSAVGSAFSENAYGAFVSRANHVQFTDDLFEQNQLDGLRLHRGTVGSTVVSSAAARNGANGFVISRGASGNALRDNLAVNNASNGFLINGLALVNGASPSGGQTVASVGTVIEHNDAEKNGRAGILVEGGAGTIVRNNIVCSALTGIAVRQGATDTFVVGNQLHCGPRVAISVGPGVTGTTLDGNAIDGGRIGILIRNSPGIRLMNNHIAGMAVFGISVRGNSPGVVGNDNVISGYGFRAIDTRSGASSPVLKNSDVSGWVHQSQITFWSYLRFHPLITTWLVILLFVFVSGIAARLRRRAPRPYEYAMPWRSATLAASSAPSPVAVPVAAAVPMVTAAARPLERIGNGAGHKTAEVPVSAVLYQPFAQSVTPEGGKATPAAAPQNGSGRAVKKRKAPVAAAVTQPAEEVPVPQPVSPPAPEPQPAPAKVAGPPTQFWKWLADGTWAGDDSRAPIGADREKPA
jgi:hypothetical protein